MFYAITSTTSTTKYAGKQKLALNGTLIIVMCAWIIFMQTQTLLFHIKLEYEEG